jgi:glycosyltransferase involved in cell wall biosynthesis
MAKIKFYAQRYLTIDGKEYNAGDVVFNEVDLPGLVRADDEVKQWCEPKFKELPASVFFNNGERPKVSVIITFSNQLRFIKPCLRGFLGQSVQSPYEILTVVDNSEEGEADFIRKNFPGVRVFEISAKSASVGRNLGIENAEGKFLAFFDGDDIPYPQYLEKLLSGVENTGADFSYGRFEHEQFPAEKGKLPRCNIFDWSDSWTKFSPITNTPVLIRKEKCPKWPEGLPICQDMGFALKLQGLKGFHVRERIFYYRLNPQSVWSNFGVAEKKKKAFEILQKNYGLEKLQADCTFVSLISRDEVLEEYFRQIPTLGLPKKTHWFILLDTDDEQFVSKVKGIATKWQGLFLSTRFYVSGEKNLADGRSFDDRGLRIARWVATIINQAGEKLGGSPFLFMVEDDTVAPKNAFKTLWATMERNPKCAYMSGVECGRGFTRHTGVCNLIEDESGEIVGRDIPKMKNSGIEKIGGGGFYCWIGRTALLKKFLTEKKFRSVDGKMLGVDVLMVNDLGKMGFDCLCDFSVQCQHYNGKIKQWLQADTGKGYDIKYFKDREGMWKMELTNKL